MGNNSELRQRIPINVLHYCVTAKLPRRLTCSSEFTQIIKMAGDTISASIEFFSLHYTIATIKDVLGQTELGLASGFQIILLPWMLPLPRLNFKNRKRKKKKNAQNILQCLDNFVITFWTVLVEIDIKAVSIVFQCFQVLFQRVAALWKATDNSSVTGNVSAWSRECVNLHNTLSTTPEKKSPTHYESVFKRFSCCDP